MTVERWLPVPDRPLYEVSDAGRVRRVGSPRALNPVVNPVTGYCLVNLYNGAGRRDVQGWLVHRLVATVFIPNVLHRPQVNHLNLDRFDNRACNLQWVTAAQNNEHARLAKPPKYATGANVFTAKLNPQAALVIRHFVARGRSMRLMGRLHGVGHRTVGALIRSNTWRTG